MTQATELRELASLLRVNGGNVGIGPLTADPPHTLSLGQTNVAGAQTIRLAGNGNPKHEIQFREAGVGYGFTFRYAGDVADNKLHIVQHENDTSGTEVMTFKRDSMEVGIGTDSPDLLYEGLHIKSANPSLKIEGTATNSWEFIHLKQPNHDRLIGMRTTGNIVINSGTNLDANNMLVIDTTGKVGINVEYPDHDLDVDGAIATKQVRHSIRPTLNLDFANSKELDPLVSFNRDTVATYYNDKGILSYANANEPRFDHDPITKESLGLLIEEERENYTDQSVILWKAPGGNGNPYMAPNVAISPDGTFNASKMTIQNTGNSYWSTLHTGNNTGTYWTASGYVKKYDHRYATILCLGDFVHASYDLDTGTVVGTPAGFLADIVDVGNGWYRIWLRNDGTGTNDDFYFGSSDSTTTIYNGVVGKGNYFWGIQVEEGKFPTSYIPSINQFAGRASVATYHDENGLLTTASKNMLRHGYKYDVESESWIETGPIYEPANTNRIFYSNWLTNVQSGCDFFGNNDTSPTGAQNAGLLHWDANSSNQIWVKSVDANGPFTCSGYFKYYQGATVIDFTLFAYQSSNNGYRGVRLTHVDSKTMTIANAIGSNAVDAYGSEYVGNGWHRVWFTTTLANSTSQGYSEFNINREAVSDVTGSADWLYYGGQMEAGPVMSSHIEVGPQPINSGRSWPNSGVTRTADTHLNLDWPHTRKADVAQINGSNIGDWFTQGKGTLYAEGISKDLDTYFPGFVELNKNSSGTTDRIQILGRPSGIISFQIYKDNSPQAIISNLSGNMRTSVLKAALAYDKNDVAFTFSGNSTPYLDTAAEIPYTNYISIGEQNEGYMNGTIKKIAYYPERLSDSEIQALTENN